MVLEIPRTKRKPSDGSRLERVKEERNILGRDRAIHAAHVQHGYSLTEIAAQLDLHYSSISKIAKRLDESADKVE